MFHSCTKLIASDSDIDEAFKSMHQKLMHDDGPKIVINGLSDNKIVLFTKNEFISLV